MKRMISIFLLLALSFCLLSCDSNSQAEQSQATSSESEVIQNNETEKKETPAYIGTWVPTNYDVELPVYWFNEDNKGTVIYNEGEYEWSVSDMTYQCAENGTIITNYIEWDEQETISYKITGERMILYFEGDPEGYPYKRISTKYCQSESIWGSWQYWTGFLYWIIGDWEDEIDVNYLHFDGEGTYYTKDHNDIYMYDDVNNTLEIWIDGYLYNTSTVEYPCPGILILRTKRNDAFLYYWVDG